MKLIEKTLGIDEDTFAPTMVLTISVPIEAVKDTYAMVGQDELEKIIGKEFLSMLKN